MTKLASGNLELMEGQRDVRVQEAQDCWRLSLFGAWEYCVRGEWE